MCALICCNLTTRVPVNYALLLVFTLCEGWTIAMITARYDKKIVTVAGAGCALISIALSIYACFSKESIEYLMGLAFIVCLAMIPVGILCIFMSLPALKAIYCMLGLIFYSIFLLIDTKMIMGGKSFGNYDIQVDDYIMGALMLYMDIIMIFLYLLSLLGGE